MFLFFSHFLFSLHFTSSSPYWSLHHHIMYQYSEPTSLLYASSGTSYHPDHVMAVPIPSRPLPWNNWNNGQKARVITHQLLKSSHKDNIALLDVLYLLYP